ncbi:Type IV leader peptidase family protein [Lachnospiraceae bacterium C10]|nr:Type IV leader peptidase family protein [Lachnospiraceae bacterium C10]SDW53971.1 Flp pilus assembly protein, protease CpaA [Lachnospiraceae bacterium KHCPX20]
MRKMVIIIGITDEVAREVMQLDLGEGLLVSYLAAVTVADLKWKRIPNEMILLGIWTGGCVSLSTLGVKGIGVSVMKGIATLLLLYVLYLIHALGAGDIKLYAVIAMYPGNVRIQSVVYFSFLTGALAGLVRMIRKRQLLLRLSLLLSHIFACVRQRRFVTYQTLEVGDSYLPFALYISLGYLIHYVWEVKQ